MEIFNGALLPYIFLSHFLSFAIESYIYAGLHNMWQLGSRAVRKWRDNEKMKRKWRENEKMKRKWRDNEEEHIANGIC